MSTHVVWVTPAVPTVIHRAWTTRIETRVSNRSEEDALVRTDDLVSSGSVDNVPDRWTTGVRRGTVGRRPASHPWTPARRPQGPSVLHRSSTPVVPTPAEGLTCDDTGCPHDAQPL
ncbi:hypothetical protein GCM10009814_09660 [Lapillicoccus jejuensis]